MHQIIITELQTFSDPQKAQNYARFFKTGKGEYGEGDVFRGIRVPEIRIIAKRYHGVSFLDIQKLLQSPIHEQRLCGAIILVYKYQNLDSHPGAHEIKTEIINFYIQNISTINNRDLVDTSADKILGQYILDFPASQNNSETQNLLKTLDKFSISQDLRERRISILATFQLIKNGEFELTLKYAKILLNDPHDLIHKVVGRMLREIGKKDLAREELFLQKHYNKMPRTMLRYAIERFPENLRLQYLKGKIV